jgi:hypothetical protein
VPADAVNLNAWRHDSHAGLHLVVDHLEAFRLAPRLRRQGFLDEPYDFDSRARWIHSLWAKRDLWVKWSTDTNKRGPLSRREQRHRGHVTMHARKGTNRSLWDVQPVDGSSVASRSNLGKQPMARRLTSRDSLMAGVSWCLHRTYTRSGACGPRRSSVTPPELVRHPSLDLTPIERETTLVPTIKHNFHRPDVVAGRADRHDRRTQETVAWRSLSDGVGDPLSEQVQLESEWLD